MSIGLPTSAAAQDYPNRHIRVIMPLGPGGVGDVFLRALGETLESAEMFAREVIPALSSGQ